MENTGFVLEKLKKNFIDNHVSFVFEDICREYLIDLSAKGVLDFTISKIGKWWDKNTETDIAGISEDGTAILLGECKYTQKKVDVNVYYNLKKKSKKVDLGQDAQHYYVIFSNSGFTPTLLEQAQKEKTLFLFRV